MKQKSDTSAYFIKLGLFNANAGFNEMLSEVLSLRHVKSNLRGN